MKMKKIRPGFVSAVKMEGRRFTNLSDYEECEIPEYTKKNLGIIRDALIEAVAETSEIWRRYFSGEEFTQDEIYTAVQTNVCQGNIVPVMMGSGINCQGFHALLNAIDRYFPSPDEAGECIGVDVSNGERFTAKYNDEVSLSAKVFKTVVDPFIGKYSMMKILPAF